MVTDEKPSELINQAITNLSQYPDSGEVMSMLWACMKMAALAELKARLKEEGVGV